MTSAWLRGRRVVWLLDGAVAASTPPRPAQRAAADAEAAMPPPDDGDCDVECAPPSPTFSYPYDDDAEEHGEDEEEEERHSPPPPAVADELQKAEVHAEPTTLPLLTVRSDVVEALGEDDNHDEQGQEHEPWHGHGEKEEGGMLLDAEEEEDDVRLDERRSSAVVAPRFVRMLIDGEEETFDVSAQRAAEPHAAVAPTSAIASAAPFLRSPPPTAGAAMSSVHRFRGGGGGGGVSSRPSSASERGRSRVSARRSRESHSVGAAGTQLTFSSDLSLAFPSTPTSRVAAAAPLTGGVVEHEEEVRGTVPALFHPRNREVQQRMTAGSATPASRRKATISSGSNSNKSAAGGAGGSAGKRRIPEAGAVGGAASEVVVVRDETSQSRFASCPICGQSQPLALINHHLDVECDGSQPRSAEKRRTTHTQAEPEPLPPSIPPRLTSLADDGEDTAASSSSVIPPAAASAPRAQPPLPTDSAASASSAPLSFNPPRPVAQVPASAAVSVSVVGEALTSASHSAERFDAVGSSAGPPSPPSAVSMAQGNTADPLRTPLEPVRNSGLLTNELKDNGDDRGQWQPSADGADTTASEPRPAVVGGAAPIPASSVGWTAPSFPSPLPITEASASPDSAADSAAPLAAARESAVHPLFSQGPRTGAAFSAKRRGRLDAVKPTTVARFHLRYRPCAAPSSSSSSSPSSAFPGVEESAHAAPQPTGASFLSSWEVAWVDDTASPSGGSSAVEANGPLVLCVQRYQEPDSAAVTEVRFSCDPAVYDHSPAVDFTSPELPCAKTRYAERGAADAALRSAALSPCAALTWAAVRWAVLCWAMLFCAVLCCAVLCCAVLCCAVLRTLSLCARC